MTWGPLSVLVKKQQWCALNPLLIPCLASLQHGGSFFTNGQEPFRLAQLPTERRDTRPHGSTVTLSLPSSSGSLLLGTKLILPRSCLSRALWIGSNRIPPDSKFQTASRASLPNTLGSFSWVSAWLCSPSYPDLTGTLSTPQGTQKLRKAQRREATESQSAFSIVPLLSQKPLKLPSFREPCLFFLPICAVAQALGGRGGASLSL